MTSGVSQNGLEDRRGLLNRGSNQPYDVSLKAAEDPTMGESHAPLPQPEVGSQAHDQRRVFIYQYCISYSAVYDVYYISVCVYVYKYFCCIMYHILHAIHYMIGIIDLDRLLKGSWGVLAVDELTNQVTMRSPSPSTPPVVSRCDLYRQHVSESNGYGFPVKGLYGHTQSRSQITGTGPPNNRNARSL